MTSLEEQLAQGVKDGKIPHAVVYATNADGSFTYSHATGYNILGQPEEIKEDALFFLASSTKLLTSIAALQTVDQGLIGLDDDVAKHLPELAELPIIKGFDVEEAILEKRKNTITLRLLLSHSAGVCYDFGHPYLTKWKQQRGQTANVGGTLEDRFLYPLVYEPGTNWMYSTSIDWAGRLVERLTGLTLDEYMKKNMWPALGITGITFWPDQHADLQTRVPALTARTPDGTLVLNTDPFINHGLTDCFGGHGGYGRTQDYLTVLRSLLANDGALLRPATVHEMFTPQLSPASKAGLAAFRSGPFANMTIGENVPGIEADWGLGGILYMQDDEGRRRKGTLNWGGMANTFWLVDREADLALAFGTQVIPPGDPGTTEMITAVEKEVYRMVAAAKA